MDFSRLKIEVLDLRLDNSRACHHCEWAQVDVQFVLAITAGEVGRQGAGIGGFDVSGDQGNV